MKIKRYKAGEAKHDAKILAWDLETSDLRADWGWIISAAWCDLSDPQRKIHHIRIDDYKGFNNDRTNDRSLCVDLANALSAADIWVTWYGDRFDIPFANTRLIAHGLDVLPTIPSIDGWKAARNHLKMASNRLGSAAELVGAESKTPVGGALWRRARCGHRDGIDYVVEHNLQDIVVLGQVYDALRPVIRNHPNVNLVEHSRDVRAKDVKCVACGSDRVHSRGYRIAKSRRSVRYQCQDCGTWFQGRSEPVQPAKQSGDLVDKGKRRPSARPGKRRIK